MSASTIPTEDRHRLIEHAKQLAPHQIKLLLVAVAIGIVGCTAYVTAFLHRPAAQPAMRTINPPGSSLIDDKTVPAPQPEPGAATTDTWTGWSGHKGMTLGFGFAGGFMIGFIFRAFLRIMTLIALAFAGVLAALSYFHVLNIDLSAAHNAYATNAQWITDQALRLKDVLISHLPSSTTGTVGVFFGARRR